MTGTDAQRSSARIVFMGTPDFAVPSLEILCEHGLRPIAVVTAPDKPRGRGQKVSPTAVKAAAERLGIETILQPESVRDPAFAQEISALSADVIVVVAFRILPPEVFNASRLGTFNLHGSLLPKYRGAAPINRAIMAGDGETGVTTFFLREAVDTGNVILKRSMPIGPDETAGEVHDRMMILGAEAVLETVQKILNGTADAITQDDSQATPAPKIFREDTLIDWSRTASEVHDHVRGLSPFPGAWTLLDGVQLKIFRTLSAEGTGRAGEVISADSKLIIACGQDAVEVLEIQQEGRRRVNASDFLRGYDLAPGTLFG
jgi:methionyl-tRNA formyltransferase